MKMLDNKLSPIVKPLKEIQANQNGIGKHVYNPYADTPQEYVANATKAIWHFMAAQVPGDTLATAWELISDKNLTPDQKRLDTLKLVGQISGFTFSQGAQGGPAMGELFRGRAEQKYAIEQNLPEIKKAIKEGRMDEATAKMQEVKMAPGLQKFMIQTTSTPAPAWRARRCSNSWPISPRSSASACSISSKGTARNETYSRRTMALDALVERGHGPDHRRALLPQVVPAGTLIGRSAVGPGPAEAIPFSRLTSMLTSVPWAFASTVSVAGNLSTAGDATVAGQLVVTGNLTTAASYFSTFNYVILNRMQLTSSADGAIAMTNYGNTGLTSFTLGPVASANYLSLLPTGSAGTMQIKVADGSAFSQVETGPHLVKTSGGTMTTQTDTNGHVRVGARHQP